MLLGDGNKGREAPSIEPYGFETMGITSFGGFDACLNDAVQCPPADSLKDEPM